MRTRVLCLPWCWLLLFAGVARAASDPVPVSARQAAYRLIQLLRDGDLDTARQESLGFDEYRMVSKRGLDRKEFETSRDDFLREVLSELRAGVVFQEATCADVLILPKSEKTRRELVLAVIQVRFRVPGQTEELGPLVFTFLDLGGRWKFFLRK